MIEGLKPYMGYKKSGVPWVGSVPENWRVERTKWLFRSRKELNVGRRNKNVLSLTLRGVVNNDPDSPEGMVPKDYATYQLFRKNDLVFKLIDLENIRTSRVGLVHEDGIMSSAYVRLIPPHDANVRFYYLQFYDLYTRAVFNALGAGVRSTLGSTDLGEVRIIVPPPDEQAAIVRFLDHANQKIDGFIRAKRKLIGLLNEQKQAIIHRAVTCGLHRDVPLKPSGIPWLGDIPKHWEVRKIKSLVSTYGGMTPSKGEAEYWKGSIPWVSPKDMKVREIRDSQDHISTSALRKTGIALIQPPAVLIVVRGMILARTFPTAITAVPVTINQDMKALVTKPGLSPEYFVSLLTGIQRDLLLLIEIAGHGTCCLRTDAWGSFAIPVPPLSEQNEIEQHLKDRLSIQNTAIARTEREIALMQEYRTRLTADIVTGKLDVREAAVRLPETSEPTPVDEPGEDAEELEDVEA